MKYLDFFDDCYYINLNHRTDRRELFEKRSNEVGINAIRFSAIEPNEEDCPLLPSALMEKRRKYKVGCTLSHKMVVKLADERNLENVLIFEDDCVFLDGFEEKVKKCVNELKSVEWDIIYFGGEVNNYCVDVSENLVKVENGGVYCTHAYAVNKSFYPAFINMNEHNVDVIDIFLLNYSVSKRTYILSRELLAIQDSIHSDIQNITNSGAEIHMRNSWEKYVPKYFI
jgi:GR25 family glycosyltransferase involved in LPS biosynthesis